MVESAKRLSPSTRSFLRKVCTLCFPMIGSRPYMDKTFGRWYHLSLLPVLERLTQCRCALTSLSRA
uniref:Uncharacterized protein n=1 Tax=Hyaloperonospora arabidopsidis (strain Emoy2) TaxID=559515 RepID=M4BK78_HYAAE